MFKKTPLISICTTISLLFICSSVFAQESVPLKTVTFTVTIEKLDCSGSVGQSIVKFENTPMEGGYYEITGKKIEENNISLSREVPLPPGTYFWNGVPNGGYATSSVSSGTFVIKECSKTKAATQTMTAKKSDTVIPQTDKKSEEIAATTSLPESVTEKEKKATTTSESSGDSQRKTLAVVLALGIVVGVALWKRSGK